MWNRQDQRAVRVYMYAEIILFVFWGGRFMQRHYCQTIGYTEYPNSQQIRSCPSTHVHQLIRYSQRYYLKKRLLLENTSFFEIYPGSLHSHGEVVIFGSITYASLGYANTYFTVYIVKYTDRKEKGIFLIYSLY